MKLQNEENRSALEETADNIDSSKSNQNKALSASRNTPSSHSLSKDYNVLPPHFSANMGEANHHSDVMQNDIGNRKDREGETNNRDAENKPLKPETPDDNQLYSIEQTIKFVILLVVIVVIALLYLFCF